jgi:hypothetical protein
MNQEIVNNTMVDMIKLFNIKDNLFFRLWKEYSMLTYNNKMLKGNEIHNFFINLKHTINIKKYDYNMIGDRRANILLSGILDNTNSIVTMFIQLAYDNNKEYWIHSSIIQIFELN